LCTAMSSIVCLFFFQAEDGIRDPLVTGVQTCALPIFAHFQAMNLRRADGAQKLALRREHDDAALRVRRDVDVAGLVNDRPAMARSEERRVGKECRSRWSRDHGREKTKSDSDESYPMIR